MDNLYHTPGPWDIAAAAGETSQVFVTKRTFCGFIDIAEVLTNEQANAQLIAAAPELKDRLYKCLNLLEQYYPMFNSCEFIGATYRMLVDIHLPR